MRLSLSRLFVLLQKTLYVSLLGQYCAWSYLSFILQCVASTNEKILLEFSKWLLVGNENLFQETVKFSGLKRKISFATNYF